MEAGLKKLHFQVELLRGLHPRLNPCGEAFFALSKLHQNSLSFILPGKFCNRFCNQNSARQSSTSALETSTLGFPFVQSCSNGTTSFLLGQPPPIKLPLAILYHKGANYWGGYVVPAGGRFCHNSVLKSKFHKLKIGLPVNGGWLKKTAFSS